MDASITKLMRSIEACLLPKLERNCEECKTHNEYLTRKEKLSIEFPVVLDTFGNLDLKQTPADARSILAALLILFEELRVDAVWNKEISPQYHTKLNCLLDVLYEVTFENLLRKKSFYDPQEVFDACMENLHHKLTPEHFKMYPATIEVYCKLLKDIKEYNVAINPQKILPAALLLIDDYVTAHRTKGLNTCAVVLQSMTADSFSGGNYYEVIYKSLKNSLTVQYVDVNKLSHVCLLELLKLLPDKVKINKSGDLFVHTLEQVYTESNLLRKANNFRFSKKLIEIHGVNCAKRKTVFTAVICDSLETCTNAGVAEILLQSILECLEEWIKYCWCVWNLKLPCDRNLMSLLLKIMYVNNNESLSIKLQEILETLICISTKEDQKQILCSLESRKQLTNIEFLKKLEGTKKGT